MTEQIKKLVSDQLGIPVDGLDDNGDLTEVYGADSLDIFQIIMGIEEAFDIEIENEDAEKIVTVGDAVEQIKNATN